MTQLKIVYKLVVWVAFNRTLFGGKFIINPLNPELNPIC
jgi:hypothetical protein